MLRVSDLGRRFGGIRALHEVTFEVEPGSICALIGPNGAGKTTLINVVTGLLRPTSGRVFLGERDITGLAPHDIAAAGVARTFQNIRLFGDLSVVDNVMVGRHLHRGDSLFDALFALPRAWRAERESHATAMRLLAQLRIERLATVPGAALSYGDQRRLEIARALALEPVMLLLDEPTAGMNAGEARQLSEELFHLRASGLALLVVEHNVDFVMRISDQVVVLNFGMMIASGSPQEIRRNRDVIAAYLGDDESVPDEEPI